MPLKLDMSDASNHKVGQLLTKSLQIWKSRMHTVIRSIAMHARATRVLLFALCDPWFGEPAAARNAQYQLPRAPGPLNLKAHDASIFSANH